MPEPPELFDSHCHLERKTYGDELEAVIERARDAGVRSLVAIGSGGSLAQCDEAIERATSDPRIWATVGFHPHEAAAVGEAEYEGVRERADHDRVVAIGEIGLDYHYDNSPRETQQEVFRRFVGLARELDLPIVIHNRESDDDCGRILQEERAGDVGGVIHCFTAGWELARTALDLGFYIGFTGIVSFGSADAVRDVLRRVPRDRIVIETDSPYLAPKPKRGRRNEPAYVAHVAAAVARVLDAPVEEIARQTTENARRLYRIGEPS